jgi:hypothetical protein
MFRLIFGVLALLIVGGWYLVLGDNMSDVSQTSTIPAESSAPATPVQPFSAPPQ